MAVAVAPSIAVAVRCLLPCASAHTESFQSLPITLPLSLQRNPLFSSRARTLSPLIAAASSSKRKNKKKVSRGHVTKRGDGEDEDEDEDAFELLFKQLEEDLKNDDLSKDGGGDDDDDEITEEDLALLERELEDALEDFDAETLNPVINEAETGSGDEEEEENDVEETEEVEEDERLPKLRTWQMKKLARALKAGKRKTSIKNLAADLCLDRALVLELLRDPPPNLLMMSLSIPDEPTARVAPLETKSIDKVREEISMDHTEPEPTANAKVPVHVMQHRWSAQKRLKKAQIDTLEKVYRRSKRPTNAMISSIVHVTNIPRRKVVKWFEDKRAEGGIPENRAPYQRPISETDLPPPDFVL